MEYLRTWVLTDNVTVDVYMIRSTCSPCHHPWIVWWTWSLSYDYSDYRNLKSPWRWSAAFKKLWKTVQFWSCCDENAEDAAEMVAERQPRWPNALTTRGNLRVIHLCGKWQTEVHDVHAKKTYAAQATRGMGIGGARAAISWPKAVAVTTQTVNPCRPAHPWFSLIV